MTADSAPTPNEDAAPAEATPAVADAPALAKLRRGELAAAAFSGVVLALSFPGIEWAPLAWVALVPFCLAVFKPRRKRGMMGLFAAFGTGFYLTLLYWFLAMHPLTWLGFSVPESFGIVSVAWLGATFLLVLQLMSFGWVFGYAAQRWSAPSWKHVVALATGWVTLEWLSSLGAFGFTWGNLALSQYKVLPLIQGLDLFGAFPLAGLIVGVNGAIALSLGRCLESAAAHSVVKGADAAVIDSVARQWGKPFSFGTWKPVAVALAPVAALLGYGAWRLSTPLPATTFDTEIVQGNFAGGDKWVKEGDPIGRMANKYLKLSEEHLKPQLVLWPETAIPVFIRNDGRMYARMQGAAIAQNRYLMIGTLDWEGYPPHQKLFNAVTAWNPKGESLGFDYKRHLVPFGEYVPGRDLLPPALMQAMGLINIVGHDYAPGVTPHIFNLPFAQIGAGVCYDGIFPDAMRPVVLAGADVLALVTNDSWYKDTTAPRVLNAHAALRAVENRRYVLRAANTGICSIIEPTGRVVATTPVFKDATLVGGASPIKELTLYTRFGDWASQLAALGFLAFLVNRWKNRARKSA